MILEAAIEDFFLSYGLDKTYWVAYSGGLDSHVLLALSAALRAKLSVQLRALHINHGLSPYADQWAKHCTQICAALDVPYTQQKIFVKKEQGSSLEEVARIARYRAFASYLQKNDILLTAHHEDDQAETALLQLLRGAGLKGLSAMPVIKKLGSGQHARPLLGFSRKDLELYAKQQKLSSIEDESNFNTQLSRNFMRQTVLPLLKEHFPAATKTIARAAAHCAEAQVLLEEYGLASLKIVQGSKENTLSVQKLKGLSLEKQKLVLRLWIQTKQIPMPNIKKLNTILTDVLHASWDAIPCVTWGETQLRRYGDDLYLIKTLSPHDIRPVCAWDCKNSLVFSGVGELHAEPHLGKGLRLLDQVMVKFRQGGEKIHVAGVGHSSLKHFFQAQRVPPWERDRIPLIYAQDRLISVVGYYIHPDFMAAESEVGVKMRWQFEI